MIQLSILKITGYGPWTLTLGSDREHELQMLQASLYKQLQQLFSEKNCLVFLNRADEFFVVSNGVGLEEHIEIQKTLEKSFKVNLTISIGFAESPFEANLKAYDGRKNEVILDKQYNIFGFVNDYSDSKVTIMHLDVDDLSSKRTTNSPYEISSLIFPKWSRCAITVIYSSWSFVSVPFTTVTTLQVLKIFQLTSRVSVSSAMLKLTAEYLSLSNKRLYCSSVKISLTNSG